MQDHQCNRRKFIQTSAAIGCGLLLPGIATAANIHELSGKVFINKNIAAPGDQVRVGDLVTTSHDGRISFSVGGDAFLLKERTSLRVESQQNSFVSVLRLFTGKLLSVFETGFEREIVTSTATIGIRGTACFLNVQPKSTYYCNCYGKTEVRAANFAKNFEAVHHNAHQLDFDGKELMGMEVMKVIDHSDEELRQLERYVGRVPLFDR